MAQVLNFPNTGRNTAPEAHAALLALYGSYFDVRAKVLEGIGDLDAVVNQMDDIIDAMRHNRVEVV